MAHYRIISSEGVDMGVYQGETEAEAVRAMLADAGAASAEPDPGLRVEEIEPAVCWGVASERAACEAFAAEHGLGCEPADGEYTHIRGLDEYEGAALYAQLRNQLDKVSQ